MERTTTARRATTARQTTTAWRTARWSDVALVAVLLGAGLRLWRWGANWPLWLDEEMISRNIRERGFGELTGTLGDNQSAPLGWLWVQRAVVELLGTGERALRLVPVLFGIAALIVSWLIARRWLGPVGAVALVGFTAVNQAFVAYSTEVKHYSADAFWVLALLGLAGWAAENPRAVRRLALWWVAAAIGAWFSMGAILVVPGLAVVLVVAGWRQAGWASALRGALLGLVWLASFGTTYLLALRYTTTGNPYMTAFWDRLGYPPATAGPLGTVRWMLNRPRVLAADPLHLAAGIGGTFWPQVAGVLFWLLVLVGFAVAARRRLTFGLLLAAPVVTAFALAYLRVVPLVARLALWIVPALLIAVACALDAAARQAVRLGRAWRGRRPPQAAGAAVPATALLMLLVLVPHTASAIAGAAQTPLVDDRAAVAFLRSQHRPGDLTLFVGSATRAAQWYDPGGELLPYRMVVAAPANSACDPAALPRTTEGYQRVLAYGGIRAQPNAKTYQILADRLAEIGQITETRHFGGGHSVVYVVELHRQPRPAVSGSDGCIVVS